MITKLTKAQQDSIPYYVDKWIKKASEPIDREASVRITKELFGQDKTVLIADSIRNACDIIKYIANGKDVKYNSQLDSQLRSQLYSQLGSQLDSQLDSQLESQLDSQLRSQLDSQLESQLDSQLRSQLGSQLYSQLYSQLRSQLGSQLYSQLRSQLGSQLDSANITYSYYTTLFWYDWYGYYDFAKSIGVQFDEGKFKRTGEIILNIPLIITLGNVLIVIAKPGVKWNNGQLHSEKPPAISWKDNTGIYFLNAVRFEKELWEKIVKHESEGGLSFSERLAIKDIDQRTQALNPKWCDINKFLAEVKAELLDEVNKLDVNAENVNYKLYKIPKGNIFTEDAYYCYFDCPSTGKKHFEGVEVSKTVAGAMAWAESNEELGIVVTPEMWQRMVPLVHEN